jgi:hypothetical protein
VRLYTRYVFFKPFGNALPSPSLTPPHPLHLGVLLHALGVSSTEDRPSPILTRYFFFFFFFALVGAEHTTAESYVFLQPDGERSIIMASGGTSTIDAEVIKNK